MSELRFFRVVCVPVKGSPACAPNRGKRTYKIKAYSSENAVSLTCKDLDIHPINYAFSTDDLGKAEKDGK